jgi:hypothetical protein
MSLYFPGHKGARTGRQGAKTNPTYIAQADSGSAQDAQAGLRNAHPRLRLERRLLRSKDGNGLW